MSEIKNSYAVIIGINQYAESSWQLKTAANDACKLSEILKDKYEYEILQLVDEQATGKTLSQLLTDFENQTIPFLNGNKRVEPDDRVLFYFAGHGIAIKGQEKDDGPQGFIYPQDATREDNNSLLPMRRLHDALMKLGCHHLLIILDCCFAGSFRWVVRQAQLSEEDMYLERYNRYITGCAQEVITSAAYNETAADYLYGFGERGEDDRHSPFACALFEALNPDNEKNADYNKDGVVTITEITQHIEQKFLEMNSGQTPGYSQLKKHDFGKYIFVIPGFDAASTLEKAPLPDEKDPRYPYKGLLSFEKEDKDKFFGRKKLIKKLAQKVKEEPFIVVLGASGSGKSSLVKAGLIPELETSTQPEFKVLDPIRPGESPLNALARVCNNIENPVKSSKTEFGRKNLNDESDYFSGIIGNWTLAHLQKKLLLVIDQFEEVVSLCRDEKERKLFLKQLAKAIVDHPEQLRIVVTLRSDYEPVLRSLFQSEFQNHAHIDLIKARLEVTPMAREELREAIVEPAEKIALFFEEKTQESESFLVDRLIDETINMPGGLSLLSFTLSELYRHFFRKIQEDSQYNRIITHKDYEELGKVTGSLTKRANEVYQTLVNKNKDYEKIIKYVMLRMVAEGSGDLARRRVFMKELEYPKSVQEKVDEVIREFTAARLLVKGQDEKGYEYVEPAHDALVRGWSRLRDWLEPKQKQGVIENLIAIQRRLTPAAEEWNNKKLQNFTWKTPLTYLQQRYDRVNFLWNDSPYLDVLKQILDSPDNWYNQVEANFVRSSIQHRENLRHLRMGLVATAFAVVSGFAFIQWCQSRDAQTGKLAALSEVSFNSNKQLQALIDALKAGKQLQPPIGIQDATKLETMTALLQSLYWVREQNHLSGHKNTIRSVNFSPNGQIIASASVDNSIKLWNLEGKVLNTLDKHKDYVNSVSFSPNGQMFASGSYDKTIKLWSINGKLLDDKRGEHKAQVYSVSFSPDGKMLASASWDGTVKLWSVKDNRLKFLKTVELPLEIFLAIKNDKSENSGDPKSYSFFGVSFSPDGNLIAAGNNDTKVRIWNREGKLLKTLPEDSDRVEGVSFSEPRRRKDREENTQGHRDGVYGVSFSPNGKTLATFGADTKIILWKVLEGEQIRTLTGHKFEVFSTSFSSDGKMLVSGSNDNTIKFWRVEDGKELTTLAGHSSAVRTVNISPDGKILASAGIDSTIKVWGMNGEDVMTLAGHSQKLYSISISPDSKTIATAGSDSVSTKNGKLYKIKLWRRFDGKELRKLLGHTSDIIATSFSPDGQTLASADNAGNIILWNLANDKPKILNKAHKNDVKSLSWSHDGKLLASASNDTTVKLWNPKGQLVATLSGDKKEVRSVSFSPDSKILALGNTRDIILWDVGQRQKTRTLTGHTAPVNSLSFSSDGKLLASGSEDTTVKLWNLPDGELPRTLGRHGEGVNSLSFLPQSDILASGSTDKTIKLWNITEGKGITTLKGHTDPIYGVSFSLDRKTLASVSSDGVALLWNTELLDLNIALARGCQLLENYRYNNSWANNKVGQTCDRNSDIGIRVKISSGDKNLVPMRPHPDKIAGIDAFIDGKFTQAAQHLQKYLDKNPNDPEALIYKNNAKIGQQKSYTIAVSVPLSSNVNGALEILRGVAQAQNEINLAGGINGVKLRVLIADDENNPKVAQQIANQLVKKPEVLGVVGNFASDVALVTSKVYNDNKLVSIYPVSTSMNLAAGGSGFGKYLFRTVPNDRQAVLALSGYMQKHQLNTKKVAIFYNSESDYSRSLKSEFERTIKSEQIVNVVDFASNKLNIATTVQESMKSGAEVFVLLPNSEKINRALEVLNENTKRQRLPVLGGDSLFSPITLEIGGENAKGMVIAVPWKWDADKSGSKFISSAQQLWRGSVSWRTAMTYDATQTLISAIRRKNTREGVAQVLQSPDFSANGASHTIQFINGDRDRTSQLVTIAERKGKPRSGYKYDFTPVP